MPATAPATPGPDPALRLDGAAKWKVAAGGLVGLLAGVFLGAQLGHALFGFAAALLLGALGLVATYSTVRGELRRTAAFAEVARAKGWTHWAGRRSDGPAQTLARCIPFRRGHGVVTLQALTGAVDGADVAVCDALYVTGGGKNQQSHRMAAAVVRMPFGFTLTIEREGLDDKIADAFGAEDIDVESDEFSRRFWVKSPDRRTAYDVLHARCVEYLLQVGPDYTWQWLDDWLVVSRPRALEPEQVDSTLGVALRFKALLPRHLLPAAPPAAQIEKAPARRAAA